MNLSYKPTDYESNSSMMVQLVYFNDRTKNTEKFYEVFTFARNSFLKYNLTRKNALLCKFYYGKPRKRSMLLRKYFHRIYYW